MEDSYGPYSLLTIGDQNYVEDKRFLVARPVRGPTNVSISSNPLRGFSIIVKGVFFENMYRRTV